MGTLGERIVVIDDSEHVRLALQAVFRRHGFRVSAAADGMAGLALIARERPGVVFLDLQMPVMDGWETIRHLRLGLGDRSTPVVAFTAEDCDPAALRSAGFCAHLPKFSSPRQLLCTARTCLSGFGGAPVAPPVWLRSCTGERCLDCP